MGEQFETHCPPEQEVPVGQTIPHAPQFAFVLIGVHAPPQQVEPAPQSAPGSVLFPATTHVPLPLQVRQMPQSAPAAFGV